MKRSPLVRHTPLLPRASLRRPAPVRRVSERRKAQAGARRRCNEAVRERAGGRCQAGIFPGCRGYGEHAHEILNRSQGGDPTDPSQCLWLCDACNGWCEDWPELAHEYGLKVWSWEGVGAARAAVNRICGRQ